MLVLGRNRVEVKLIFETSRLAPAGEEAYPRPADKAHDSTSNMPILSCIEILNSTQNPPSILSKALESNPENTGTTRRGSQSQYVQSPAQSPGSPSSQSISTRYEQALDVASSHGRVT